MRSYVVQIHEAAPGSSRPDGLRGLAREVSTGRRTPFRNSAELLRVLGASDDHEPPDPGLTPEEPK